MSVNAASIQSTPISAAIAERRWPEYLRSAGVESREMSTPSAEASAQRFSHCEVGCSISRRMAARCVALASRA